MKEKVTYFSKCLHCGKPTAIYRFLNKNNSECGGGVKNEKRI